MNKRRVKKKSAGSRAARSTADREINDRAKAPLLDLLSLAIVVLLLLVVGLLTHTLGRPQTLVIEMTVFLLGCFWELYRLLGDSKRVLRIIGVSLLFSFLAFLPGKRESTYSFAAHVSMWPFYFAISFFIVVLVQHQKLYTARLGEADTLLHTYSLWYLVISYFEEKALLLVGGLIAVPSLFALTHAFSSIPLSNGHRLWLSLWSCFVMVVFGSLYFTGMFGLSSIESSLEVGDAVIGAESIFQWFLFGLAGAYIAQNVVMLFGYLPGKHQFFNAEYFRTIRALSALHTARFLSTQIERRAAFLATILCGVLFGANYFSGFAQPSLVIWLSFAFLPAILSLLAEQNE